MFGTTIRSGLFIDYDNAAQFFPGGSLAGRIERWLAWFEDGRFDPRGRKRTFVHKRVYWHPSHEKARPPFERSGFQAKACLALAKKRHGRSAVDLHLTMDVIDTAARTRVDEAIILASDTDYMPIIERLREHGIATCIVIDEETNSAVYEGKASFILSRADLLQSITYRSQRRSLLDLFRPPAPTPAPAVAVAPKSAVAAAPKAVSDFEALVDAVNAAALKQPGILIGRKTILSLARTLVGFTAGGPNAFFGAGSYVKLLKRIAAASSAISLVACPKGGVALTAKAAPKKKLQPPAPKRDSAPTGEVLHLYMPPLSVRI